MAHQLIRPPSWATHLEIVQVVPHTEIGYSVRRDDGAAAVAIVGLDGAVPTVWHAGCDCGYTKRSQAAFMRCPIACAMRYCARKYGAANGRLIPGLRCEPDDLDRAIARVS